MWLLGKGLRQIMIFSVLRAYRLEGVILFWEIQMIRV